jgi:hypothetical protein
MDHDVNEPGPEQDEGVFRRKTDADEEEEKRVPVEYLSHIQKQRSSRLARLFWSIVLLIVICGIAPSHKGWDYCPRCGRWRTHSALAWGLWEIRGLNPVQTEWTEWYESHHPETHTHHWVPAGKVYPGFLLFITTPIHRDLGWEFPESLVERMRELESYFRPGKVLDIPRVLRAVNSSREWKAIIYPLVVGTPEEAYRWWQNHDNRLLDWARKPLGTPLPEDIISESEKYVEAKMKPEGNHIPLLHER